MRQKLTRRDLGILLAGSAAMPSGCTRSRSRGVLVSFAPLSQRSLHEEIASAFEKQNPGITIELDGARNYEALTQRTLREAMIQDTPDLSFQGLANLRLLHSRQLLRNLNEEIKRDDRWAGVGYDQSLLRLGRTNDSICGLPFQISTPTVFFNKRLVTAAGGDPDHLPQDWDGILALAERMRRTSGTSIYLDYASTNGWGFQSVLLGFGGRVTTPDEQAPAFGGAEGRATMEVFSRIYRAGQVDMSKEQASQAFAAGSLGIFCTQNSMLPILRLQVGSRFGIGVRPFPIVPGVGRWLASGSAVTILTSDRERRRLAWDYARHAVGSVAQTAVVRRIGAIPVNAVAVASSRYLAQVYQHDPAKVIGLEQIPLLAQWYAFPGANSIRIYDQIKTHIQEVITGRAPPGSALAGMLRETQSLMSSGAR